MSAAIGSILARLDDTMNPVVIKELRQAVQSRFVTVTLLLFLTVLLVTIHLFLLNMNTPGRGTSTDFTAGREIFMALQGIVAFTCILFVPIYAGIRFAAERNGENVDLLFISTIRPSSIVWGKLFSAMVVAVLIYSAVLPFMTLTYLLRGIDLPTVFVIVGLHALVILAATMGSLFLACIPTSLILKALIGLIYTGALIGVATYTTAASAFMAHRGVGSQLGTWEFWGPALIFIEKTLLGVGLLFFLAVSLVSPPSSNRALPVRLFILAAWIAELIVLVILSEAAARWGHTFVDWDEVVIGGWLVSQIILLSVALIVSICERDTWSPRVLKRVPRHDAGRLGMFLLSSGSAGGVAWCAGMIGLTLLVAWAATAYASGRGVSVGNMEDAILVLGIYAAYVYCYAMTGALIRWLWRRTLLPRVSAVFTLGLLALGCLGPVITAFFIWGNRWDDHEHFVWIFMPIGPLAMEHDESFVVTVGIVVSVWGAVVTCLAVPWFLTQWSRFRRYEPLAVPSTTSATVTP